MGNEHNKRMSITINSYQTIWNYEKKMYTILDKVVLFTPISVRDFGYFAVIEGVLLFLWITLQLPLFGVPGVILIFGVLPYVLVQGVKFLPFDGKKPSQFLVDYLKFYLSKPADSEFFRPVPRKEAVRLCWDCGFRRRIRRRR